MKNDIEVSAQKDASSDRKRSFSSRQKVAELSLKKKKEEGEGRCGP